MVENFPEQNDDLVIAENSSADYQLPEGIGISYEEIAILLRQKHDTFLSNNDPVLMLVSICNVFLAELEKLHLKHNEAMTKIIALGTQDYIESVRTNTDAFTKTLSDASIEGIRVIFEQHATDLHAAKWNMRWCAAICAVSALVFVASLAFL